MLGTLRIQNIALIEDLKIELKGGLNILSGETGAGKSIIIDSLNFVLGERADKTLIRFGAEKASVEGIFEDYPNDINEILEENGIEPDDILILRRSMTATKNECRVNGSAVTLNILKSIGERLVDIHGQHEHQSLLRVSTHINLLDNYGTNKISDIKYKVFDEYHRYHNLKKEYNSLGAPDERARKIDILEYQINELKEGSLVEGEEENLILERKKFRNAEKILNALKDAGDLMNGGSDGFSIVSAINKTMNLLSVAGAFDDSLNELSDRLDGVKADIKDIAENISDKVDDFLYDDFSAEKIEERLEKVRSLIRKYGGSVENANIFLKNAENEYNELINADDRCAKLENEIKVSAENLVKYSNTLHELRVKYSKDFEEDINTQLRELGMPSAKFKVDFKDISSNADDANENGFDNVEFMISPNKGEPLKPLQKIISGGEMSRFMLALKNITARLDGINTMVFDEIDTGISGAIAQVVAEKLYNISKDRQVIAVTHLPQLASMADVHYKIEKFETEDKTKTSVNILDEEGELMEIARLIGGSSYSDFAIPHAKEMKSHANKYKENK